MKLHTGWLPVAVSSGLKRSQRVSKCYETHGAENIRASRPVSHCHETLGAEHIRASLMVSKCKEPHWRLAHLRVSQGPKVPRNPRRRAHPRVSQCLKVPRNPRRRVHSRVSQGLTMFRHVKMAMFCRARQNSANCSQAVIVLRALSNGSQTLIVLHALSTSRTTRSGVLCTAPGERASPSRASADDSTSGRAPSPRSNTIGTLNACAGQGDAQACHNASSHQTNMQSCRM